MKRAAVLLILTALALGACGSPYMPAVPQPLSTSTVLPPKPSAFQRWTADQVVAAFKAAGCEAYFPKPLTQGDYGAAPQLAVDTLRVIPLSLTGEGGPRVYIFSFATQADLDKTRQYYLDRARSNYDIFSSTFSHDNILVQALGVPGFFARQYDAALQAMK